MNPANRSDLTVHDLAGDEFADRLRSGLGVRIGPFSARIATDCADLPGILQGLYRDYPIVPDSSVFSFHARLDQRRFIPLIRPARVRFSVDGKAPHEDMPAEQALAVLEWGINLVIALRSHAFLMLHSAVVARNDRAMLLPAAPGAGKTTLSAGLSLRGWRLFSDEFGLLRPGDERVWPVPRPLALKNDSIPVIRDYSGDAWIGPAIRGTRKGTVAHLRPPGDSVLCADQPANVRWIVFPEWRAGEKTRLEAMPKHEGFMQLATNAFNYELLGESAYRTVASVVDRAACFRFIYSDLDDAVRLLTAMADDEQDG